MRPVLRFILPLAIAGTVSAQTAADKQLAEARQELKDTQAEYTAMRTAFFREINTLDDRALELDRELRALEREAERRTSKV